MSPPKSPRSLAHTDSCRLRIGLSKIGEELAHVCEITFWATGIREPHYTGQILSRFTKAPLRLAGLVLGLATNADRSFSSSETALYDAARASKGYVAGWLTSLLRIEEKKDISLWLQYSKPHVSKRVVTLGSRWNGVQVDLLCNHIPQTARHVHEQAAVWLLGNGPEPRWSTHLPLPAVELPLLPDVWIDRPGFKKVIEQFQNDFRRGFLEITGGMGLGKTTAMLGYLHQLKSETGHGLQDRRPIFHFIGAGEKTSEAADPQFVAEGLFSQLVTKHGLSVPDHWEAKFRHSDPAMSAIRRLQALLVDLVAPRLLETGTIETIFLEAADQVDGGRLSLVPKMLGTLPERIYAVITTRPQTDRWKGVGAAITRTVNFEDIIREDGDAERKLVEQSLEIYNLDLPAEMIDAIFARSDGFGYASPVMFTVASRLTTLREDSQSRLAHRLRNEPMLWRMEPEKLVREEVDRVIQRACEPPLGMAEHEVLLTLGLCAAACQELRPSMLDGLGLRDWRHTAVLKLACNFFVPRVEPDAPWEFRHPGYRRHLVEERSLRVRIHEYHANLCEQLWRLAGTPLLAVHVQSAAVYALRYLPTHLREAGALIRLVDVLGSCEFIQARINADQFSELMSDIRVTLGVFGSSAAPYSWLRDDRIQFYITELVAFSKQYASLRKRASKSSKIRGECRSIPFPKIPRVDRPITHNADKSPRAEIDPSEPSTRLALLQHFLEHNISRLLAFNGVPKLLEAQWAFEVPSIADNILGIRIKSRSTWLKRRWPVDTVLSMIDAKPVTLGVNGGEIYTVVVTADGRRAVSATEDEVHVWDLERLEKPPRKYPSGRRVTGIAITPDGRRLVFGAGDRLLVWDLDNSDETYAMLCVPIHCGKISSVAISADGMRAICSCRHENFWESELIVWDFAETGALFSNFDPRIEDPPPVSPSRVLRLADCSDAPKNVDRFNKVAPGHSTVSLTANGGRAVCTSMDGTVRLWDIDKPEQRDHILSRHDSAIVVAVTPDGVRAVSANRDGLVQVWELNKMDSLGPRITFEGQMVHGVAISHDGERVFCAFDDATISVWDVSSPDSAVRSLSDHAGCVHTVAATANGRIAVSGGEDGLLRIWDMFGQSSLRRAETTISGSIHDKLAVTTDGTQAVNLGGKGEVRLWDFRRSKPFSRNLISPEKCYVDVAIAGEGSHALASSYPNMYIWDLENPSLPPRVIGSIKATKVAIAGDGSRAVTSDGHGRISVWDLMEGKSVGLDFITHKGGVGDIAISDDGARLLSGGRSDGTLCLTDLNNSIQLGRTIIGNDLSADRIALTLDGRRAVILCNDLSLWICDLSTSGIAPRLVSRVGNFCSIDIAVNFDGSYAFCYDCFGTIRIWKLPESGCDFEADCLESLVATNRPIADIAFAMKANALVVEFVSGELVTFDVVDGR